MSGRQDFFIFNVESNDSNFNAPSPPDPNKVLCFNTKPESDEEMVYNSAYKPNLSIDTLINNSVDSRLERRNKKKGTNKVPRRQNAWILYRKDKSVLPEFEGLKSSLISKEAAKMWNNESNVVREYFAALARLAEKRHIEKYGKDYKYQPKKSKVKQNKEKQAVENRKAMNAKQQPPTPTTSNTNSPVTPSSSEFETEQFFPTPITSNSNSPVISLLGFEGQSSNISEELFFSPLSDITRSPSELESPNLPEFVMDADFTYTPTFEQPLSDIELFSTYTLMTEFEQSPPTTMTELEQPSPNLSELMTEFEQSSPNLSELMTEFEQSPPTTVTELERPSPNLSELMKDAEFFDLSDFIMNAEDISTSNLPSFTTPSPFPIPPIQDNISLDAIQQQQQQVDWLLFPSNFDNELASFGQSELDDLLLYELYESSQPSL